MPKTFIIALIALCFGGFGLMRASDAQTLLHESPYVDFEQAFEAIENPYLSDSIKLHYQITLLEKMTRRQAELLKISESFKALGIPFKEPAPAYSLCQKLPVNTPCLRHYPALYKDLVSDRRKHYSDIALQMAVEQGHVLPSEASGLQIDPAIQERIKREQEAFARKQEEERLKREAQERQNRYRWSEINCLSGQCEGVITGANGFRSTVRKGSRLPDGVVVESVNRTGIVVMIDKNRIHAQPLPAGTDYASAQNLNNDGGLAISGFEEMARPEGAAILSIVNNSNTALAGGAQPANIISGQAGQNAAGNSANANQNGSNFGNIIEGPPTTGLNSGGVSVVEPALGPSGLF